MCMFPTSAFPFCLPSGYSGPGLLIRSFGFVDCCWLIHRSTPAAKSLITTATLVQGPGKASNSTPSINGSAAFHIGLEDIRTLSTQNAPQKGPIKGLLSVPDLSNDDPCKNATSPFIPSNVTRFHDVTPSGLPIIGIAPWITPNCSQSFLDASKHAGTEALLFFLPAGGDTKPPAANDTTWLLGNGHSWKEITYPVYAIPGAAGISLMERLSWNSSTGILLPGQQNTSAALSASEQWDIRLFTLIDLEKSGRKSPSFWGFLLATLGTISVFCIICLLLYQLIQRRRRENLQQRLEADRENYPQFDLQHIKIPHECLARLPVYTYPVPDDNAKDCAQKIYPNDKASNVANTKPVETTRTGIDEGVEAEAHIPKSNSAVWNEDAPDTKHSQSPQSASARIENIIHRVASHGPFSPIPNRASPEHMNRLSLSQTTCAICLDDFVPASSTVRELPCGHIFHPECIDVCLTRSSSLCPLCKKSVLEPGFCPISAPEAIYQNSIPGSWL
ncbi:hypothetical protein BDV06DRAFT_192211 [Aspergillus oleicola]